LRRIGGNAGIGQRLLGGGNAIVNEGVVATHFLGRHVARCLEILDLSGDAGVEGGGIETRDGTNA